jgi:hypothetical protein
MHPISQQWQLLQKHWCRKCPISLAELSRLRGSGGDGVGGLGGGGGEGGGRLGEGEGGGDVGGGGEGGGGLGGGGDMGAMGLLGVVEMLVEGLVGLLCA